MLDQQINQDFLTAYKNKNEAAVATLRMLRAALVNKKIEKLIAKEAELPDEETLLVIKSEIKKRQDSMEIYRRGERVDLADREQAEAELLKKYLPAQLTEAAVRKTVKETISELGVSGPGEFGKVMPAVMSKIKGQADGAVISRLVKEELSQ